jgi:hypothetical protein
VCTAIYCTFTGHGIVLKGMVWYYRSGDANRLTTEHTGVGVTKKAKVKAYHIMLRGFARDHYYTNLRHVAQTLPFDQLCNATRNYFKRPKYRRLVLKK